MTGDLALRHVEALAPATQQALRRLAVRGWIAETYLAGSAALALYTGHRPVRDLDLMTQANRLAPQERRDLLGDLLAMDPATRVETARDGYLFVRLGGEVALRLFYYPYPLVDPEPELPFAPGLLVASPVDLGLMKLGAIISRGSRRDFVDLFVLCRRVRLEELLRRAEEKFGHVGDFALQALKGLADLSAVAGEPMPRLALPLAWSEVEAWLLAEVRRLGREHAGLAAP
jgi:hypothetical protein